MDGPVEVTKQLFVRPLRNDVTREEVQDHFSRAAPVVEVRLMEGYAFVTFENEDDAKQALELLNDAEFNGEKLQIEFAKERREDTRGKYRLLITNLAEGTAWQDIKDFVREKLIVNQVMSRFSLTLITVKLLVACNSRAVKIWIELFHC